MPAPDKETLRRLFLDCGAAAVGFARAEAIEPEALGRIDRWTQSGRASGMDYMLRNSDLRADPRLLLPGARTVVSLAFSYLPTRRRPSELPYIALYAYGRDYHKELRSRLRPVGRLIEQEWGSAWRICVDSAPVAERYWSMKAGVGAPGRNTTLIVPGAGSFVVLAEMLLTLEVEPDAPATPTCTGCDACRRACPGGALSDEGLDARRCLSYLTIEHRGPQPDSPVLQTPAGRHTLFGCDICQRVCPLNRHLPATPIAAFEPSEAILSLDADALRSMTEDEFDALFAGSPLRRAGLPALRRNIGIGSDGEHYPD